MRIQEGALRGSFFMSGESKAQLFAKGAFGELKTFTSGTHSRAALSFPYTKGSPAGLPFGYLYQIVTIFASVYSAGA